MPAFVKTPKFIIGAIVVLWVAYIIWDNFQLAPVSIHLIPFAATLDFRVSAVIIGSAIFGAVVALVIQWLWKRRSKNAAVSAAASGASNRTVA